MHDFVANLFRKLCNKFYHNCPSFIEDIIQTFWSLFSGHTVLCSIPVFSGTRKVTVAQWHIFYSSRVSFSASIGVDVKTFKIM